MDFNELKSRPIEDLRMLAAQYSIRTHPKHKAETIAKLIVEHVTNPKPAKVEVMHHPAEAPKEPSIVHSEAEIRETLKHLLAKETFQVTFPGDNTAIFKCRGAEESIHLSAPLRVIRSKAEGVSRGATALRGIKGDPTNPTANSATIMMV